MDSNGLGGDTSFHIRGNIEVDGFRPVPLDNWVAPAENQGANLGAALMVSERFARIYSNSTRQASIRSVTLNVEAVPERRTMQLEGARTSSMEAHAGETITVEATVRPYRGAAKNIRIPIVLPASLPDGSIRLLVSDGGTLDRVTSPNRAGARPLDMNATIAQIEGMRTNDRLYVTLLTPAAQALLEGRTLAGASRLHGQRAGTAAQFPGNDIERRVCDSGNISTSRCRTLRSAGYFPTH